MENERVLYLKFCHGLSLRLKIILQKITRRHATTYFVSGAHEFTPYEWRRGENGIYISVPVAAVPPFL